jgi:hypothetical protein
MRRGDERGVMFAPAGDDDVPVPGRMTAEQPAAVDEYVAAEEQVVDHLRATRQPLPDGAAT